MAYTLDFAIVLPSSQTGLTLEAQLVDTSGVNVGAAITTGFTEIGVGNYLWDGASAIPDNHRGGVKFQLLSAGALKAFAPINPEEAELDKKLVVDTFAELAQGKPSATPTIFQLLMLLYMALRNKLITTTNEMRIHNDAGTVIITLALSDAAGLFTRDEAESGP